MMTIPFRNFHARWAPVSVRLLAALTLSVSLLPSSSQAQVVEWLPDIVVRESDLYNNDIVTNIVPGRRHLRFSNGTANVGLGRLHLIGVLPPIDDSTQLVLQRIFYSDGSYYNDTAGTFVYHSGHSHTHFEDWCIYRLREVLPGDGVGGIVAEGDKTSFCILDLQVYDNTLPNFNPNPYYFDCSNQVQGLSVGWLDLYTKSLPGQNFDITEIPDGDYWLESEADPVNNIRESDEDNNITRIKITLGSGSGTIALDRFEANDSIAQVLARPLGGLNSPNLGPCGPRRVMDDLSIHTNGNADYFRFYMNHTGTNADTVRIDFDDEIGDVDLRILNSGGAILLESGGNVDWEIIRLNALPEGWYYAHVYGYAGATNPYYRLTINPSSNGAPTVDVTAPPGGVTERAHGFENYTVTWSWSDPEGDESWVTAYVDTLPIFDGDELLLEASVYTPASEGFHILNSAAVQPDTYWVYCQITDGGTITGDWSAGQIAFVTAADSDGDGVFDFQDNCIGWPNPSQEPGCAHHGDPRPDGVTDILDVVAIIEVGFRSGAVMVDDDCPHAPAGRTDLNCDGATDVLDIVMMIDVAFRNGVPAFCNPCLCTSYPSDCP